MSKETPPRRLQTPLLPLFSPRPRTSQNYWWNHDREVAGAACTVQDSSKMAFFGLVNPSSSESRILCMNDAGHCLLYGSEEQMNHAMPSLKGFKGPVSVSLSIAQQTGAKEEGMCVMHGVADGQESKFRFDVLRFGTTGCWSNAKAWHWQSLPLPPFVCRHGGLISSYTALQGGRTICLSSAAEGVGIYFFETVRGEWSRTGDWVLPFTGRAQYVADLNLWLGFSLQYPHDLCAASGLSASATNQPQTLPALWQHGTPGERTATTVNLLNLGSGRFVIAKFCKVIRSIGESVMVEDAEDEFLDLTGVEIRCDLQKFQHKYIRYMRTDDTIHKVL